MAGSTEHSNLRISGRRRPRRSREISAVEAIAAGVVIAAVIAMIVWFFFFSSGGIGPGSV
jgi:hypothetical protein